eukprot:SAG31_NODE_23364_length_506_cov_0.587224_1_plen_61_part_10
MASHRGSACLLLCLCFLTLESPTVQAWSSLRRILGEGDDDGGALKDLPSNCDVVEVGCFKV